MGSIVRTGGSNIDRSADLRGLSTDTKPTRAQGDNVPHGSTWYNMDDCTKYMYNADNDTWYNIPNGGGGTGDMQKSIYDPTNAVANAGGIDSYVGSEIDNAITEVEGNIAPIANNLINDTVGWTNKNLLPITLDQLKAINTSGTWEDNVYTYRGITITVDIFNNLITGINVNGANTAGSVVFKLTDNFVYQLLSEDKYYISDGVDTTAIVSGSAYISVERKKGESGESHYLSTNNEERSTKFTVDYSVYDYYFVNIYIPNNSSINNAVFYPMIRRASISDDTYEPYTETVKDEIFNLNSSVGNLKSRVGRAEGNITTLNEIKANTSDLGTASTKDAISVVTDSTDLVESGAVYDAIGWGNKNLLDPSVITNSALPSSLIYVPVYVGSGTFTLSSNCPQASGSLACIFLLAGSVQAGASTSDNGVWNEQSRTVTAVDGYVTIASCNEGGVNPGLYNTQLEKGSTATTYEPYHESVADSLDDKMSYADNSKLGAYNILNNTANSGTIFEVDKDKVVTVNTSGISGTVSLTLQTDISNLVGMGKLHISGCPQGGSDSKYEIAIWNSSQQSLLNTATNQRVREYGNGYDVDLTQCTNPNGTAVDFTTCTIVVVIRANAGALNNLKFYPMITLESNKGLPYQPSAQTNRELTVNKCDNSVIGTVEDGTNPTKAYAVGEHFIKDGQFKEVTQPIASGGDINSSNTVDKPIAELFTKQAVTGIAVDGTVLKSIVSNNSYIIPAYKLAVLNLVVKVGTYAAWTICLSGLPKPMNNLSAVIANRGRSTAMLASIYTQGNMQLTNLTGSDPVEDNEIVISITYNYDSL